MKTWAETSKNLIFTGSILGHKLVIGEAPGD